MAIDLMTEDGVAKIREGDRAAFEQLFRGWYARLADYAARLLDNRDAAEDVVQSVFVSLWNRRLDLPAADKLPAYLHRAVRNRALNHLRDHRNTQSLSLLTDDEPTVAPAVESQLADADLASALHAALESLAPRTREVFLLSREQELTYNEIASALGISGKTVETLMGRALRALRATLRARLDE